MIENNIKNLIKILEESNVDELEISTFWGKQTIRIRKNLSSNIEKNIELIQDTTTLPLNKYQSQMRDLDLSQNKLNLPKLKKKLY